jgi:hypothetical protein
MAHASSSSSVIAASCTHDVAQCCSCCIVYRVCSNACYATKYIVFHSCQNVWTEADKPPLCSFTSLCRFPPERETSCGSSPFLASLKSAMDAR